MNRIGLYLFCLSFSTLSFTSIRAFNVFGISELSIILSLFVLLLVKGRELTVLSGYKLLDIYWIGFILLLTATLVFAEYAGLSGIGKSYHDYFAFLFCFVVVVVFINLCKIFDIREVIKVTVIFSLVSSCFLLALSPLLQGGIGNLFVIRYSGLSHNPNQLALSSIFSLYISVYILMSNPNKKEKLLSLSLLLLSIIIGFLSISDAFLLSFSTFISLSIIFKLVEELLKPSSLLSKSISFISLLIIAFASIFVFSKVVRSLIVMSEQNGQGSVRFTLWRHGFEAMLESPIFGLGPGAWSGLNYPIQGHEAHNSYIDFGNSFGFVGMLMIAMLLFYNVFKLKVTNYSYLIFSLGSLLVFGIFHYVLRFPFTWVLLSVPFFIRAR